MTPVETALFWVAATFYILAFAGLIFLAVFKKPGWSGYVTALGGAGLAAHSLTIGLRWAAIGHPPVFGSFENALGGGWFIALFTVIAAARSPRLRLTGLIGYPSALATFFYGLQFNQAKIPLTISERSLWVDIHATFAWLAYSSYLIAFALAVFILVRRDRPETADGGGSLLPSAATTDELIQKFVVYGFITQTITLATGSYYEFLVFGRWWRWDPIESITLVSWLIFALFIHLRRSFGWRGRPAAWVIVVGMLALVVGYWLLVFFPPASTFHIFDIDRRIHIL